MTLFKKKKAEKKKALTANLAKPKLGIPKPSAASTPLQMPAPRPAPGPAPAFPPTPPGSPGQPPAQPGAPTPPGKSGSKSPPGKPPKPPKSGGFSLFKKKGPEKKQDMDLKAYKSTIDHERVKKILSQYQYNKVRPIREEQTVYEAIESREFKEFEKEELQLRVVKSVFEKLCTFFSKFMTVNPSQKQQAKMQSELDYLWFPVKPEQVMSVGIFVMIGLIAFSLILAVSGLVCLPISFIFAIIGIAVFIYMPRYPSVLADRKRKRSMGEMPMVVLYMVMYIRNIPVMEGAVRFAAVHLSGPIALDFRKLLWDVEMRRYLNITESLTHYTDLWSKWDKEFADAIKLLMASVQEPNTKRRQAMLASAVEQITTGTAEKMTHYTQELKTPLTVIHSLGVTLPVMGLVMFPMVVMFMADMIDTGSLFFVYDFFLAGMVAFFSLRVLQTRPASMATMEATSDHPDIPKPGCYKLKVGDHRVDFPLLLPCTALGVAISIPAFIYLLTPHDPSDFRFVHIIQTMTMLFGAAIAIFAYNHFTNIQKLKVRNKLLKIESEFPDALYQLGNKLLSGVSLETALSGSLRGSFGPEVRKLFDEVVARMHNMNLTFEEALFHKEFGVMKYYPSSLIKSIMKVLVESSRKGMEQIAFSMLAVSTYLKKLHGIEEQVREILGDTSSSMKFQGTFLAPAISGVVVGLGMMIMQILVSLNTKVASLMETDISGVGGGLDAAGFSNMMGGGLMGVPPTPPAIFQLVVGIYMLEASLTLSYLAGGIELGQDNVRRGLLIARSVLIATIIYSLCALASGFMFGGIVETITF